MTANYLQTALADIAARNAGRPTLTVWADGSYVIHGSLDAECDTRGEPDEILLNIDIETMETVTFLDLQARIKLYENILRSRSNQESLDPAANTK